jgi:hypothetical protein
MGAIPLQPGLNRVQAGVDLRSRSIPAASPFLLFGKQQLRHPSVFSGCMLSKNRSSFRLGGLVAAWIVSYFVRQCKRKIGKAKLQFTSAG